MAVRIISTWLLGLLKRLALRHWVLCQGLAVSTGSNLTGKCVIIAIVEGWCRQGEEKGGREAGERKERRSKKGGRDGWLDGWINGGINGRMQRRGGRKGFTVDRRRRAELVKSLQMSQTCDSRLHNFKECRHPSRSASVSFCKSVGGPCSDIHNSCISTSYRGPCLRATGFLLCPAVLPCGDKTM